MPMQVPALLNTLNFPRTKTAFAELLDKQEFDGGVSQVRMHLLPVFIRCSKCLSIDLCGTDFNHLNKKDNFFVDG